MTKTRLCWWKSPWRVVHGTRVVVAVLLGSLAVHAVVFRSVLPQGEAHGYLGWYERVVAGLSLASVIGIVLAIAAVSSRRGPAGLRGLVLPARPVDPGRWVGVLTIAMLVTLLTQETLERSVPAGHFEPAALAGTSWLVAFAAALVVALCLLLLERSYAGLVAAVFLARSVRLRPSRVSGHRPHATPTRRRRALADRRGLRAPPVLGC